MPAKGVSESGLKPYKPRKGKKGVLIAATYLSPDQGSHTPPLEHWQGFLFRKTALFSLDNPQAN